MHELGVLNSEMKHSWFSWDAAIYQTTSRSRGSLHAKCRQGVPHWFLISSCKYEIESLLHYILPFNCVYV